MSGAANTEMPVRTRICPIQEDEIQKPARALRWLSVFVLLLLIATPMVLLLTPWRQNVAARGRVVAFSPLEREQRIPAPVSGRLKKMFIQEGQMVKKGDVLLEMEDLDAQFQLRLESQVRFAEQKLVAAQNSVVSYDTQLENLEISRNMEITVARYEYDQALQKAESAKQDIAAAKAELEQKRANFKRQGELRAKKLRSQFEYEKAESAFETAKAKLRSAEAKLKQAEQGSKAKEAGITKAESVSDAKIDSTRSSRAEAEGKVQLAQKELAEAKSKLAKQQTRVVKARSDGVILRIHAAGQADLVKAGAPLFDFVPFTENLAAEIYMRGNDAPLVKPGDPVRLNFEGWPAIQFVGWPSVAQGTYGGVVAVVDAHDDGRGRFRVLIKPDPDDEAWPDQPFLRQGSRVKGWVLLNEVSLGFELWRQLNGFPPALPEKPKAGKGMKQ